MKARQKIWSTFRIDKKEILANYHKLLLKALRDREQEIFLYLAILGPALGGFIWLLYHFDDTKPIIVITATIGIWLLCLLGAWYSAALGYNYRYITLQLGNLERDLEIQDNILASWVKSPEKFLKNYRIFCRIPWCTPPEVIIWFWFAFPVLIAFTMIAAYYYTHHWILILGIAPFTLGLISPIYYGCKLHSICNKEIQRNTTQKENKEP
ncbi:hypothetical protein MYX76_07155 [Desulfobacterota bacterium AH_259_B03_O07]|nr:hypothetical protein [Desulfobacterota bacterium AH_259_B03_O07]